MIQYPGSLHCHTHFSNFRLRDSIIKETQLIDKAQTSSLSYELENSGRTR